MSTKLPEGTRIPPIDRPRPQENQTREPVDKQQPKHVTGNQAKTEARKHPMKG
jgi:hypothetical protein